MPDRQESVVDDSCWIRWESRVANAGTIQIAIQLCILYNLRLDFWIRNSINILLEGTANRPR